MSKPIRVAHVFGRFDRGGAETMIMNIYQHIDRSRVQFDFVQHTQDECAFEKQAKEMGARIFSVPRFRGTNYFSYRKAWKNFFLEHRNIAIIHGHIYSTASVYLRIAKEYGLGTISHAHTSGALNRRPKALAKIFMGKKTRNVSDYFFSCSYEAGEWIFGKDVGTRPNFYLLKNAIDPVRFVFNENKGLEKRKELGIEGKFVLGHVGRFDTAKNQAFLLDIFQSVLKREKNAVLILVGDGILRPSVEKKACELGLKDRVLFLGLRSDIPELLQAMDAFVFPSIFEGLPVTIIEAQASGLLCIVSSNITSEVSVTDLVEYISLEKTVDEWADRVLSFKKGHVRRNTSEEIRSAGYDVKETAKWLEDFYLDLAGVK